MKLNLRDFRILRQVLFRVQAGNSNIAKTHNV